MLGGGGGWGLYVMSMFYIMVRFHGVSGGVTGGNGLSLQSIISMITLV
jgi:hypothetical protein